jgi:hypothetical protein
MLETSRNINAETAEKHGLLARAYSSLRRLRRIRGYPYYRLLRRIHARLKPRTYVEIGVCYGDSIVLARNAEVCVGIDPSPQIKVLLPPVARLYKTTSEAFFSNYDLTAELGHRTLDLAFIDGMHLFEFALRDFIQLERHCGRQSTILVHDCYPIDRATASRRQNTLLWSGDVWKLILCLKKHRPDLKIGTVDIAPTGLTIIRGLDPASTALASRLPELEQEFVALDYDEIDRDKPQKLNRLPNKWSEINAFLSQA